MLPIETAVAGYHVNFWDSGPDLWPRDLSQNSHAMHLGPFSGCGDHSRFISGHFGDFGPDPLCEASTCVLSQQQTSVLSAADICPVSTADICPVSTEDIYPVSTEDGTAAGLRPAAVASSVETG